MITQEKKRILNTSSWGNSTHKTLVPVTSEMPVQNRTRSIGRPVKEKNENHSTSLAQRWYLCTGSRELWLKNKGSCFLEGSALKCLENTKWCLENTSESQNWLELDVRTVHTSRFSDSRNSWEPALGRIEEHLCRPIYRSAAFLEILVMNQLSQALECSAVVARPFLLSPELLQNFLKILPSLRSLRRFSPTFSGRAPEAWKSEAFSRKALRCWKRELFRLKQRNVSKIRENLNTKRLITLIRGAMPPAFQKPWRPCPWRAFRT